MKVTSLITDILFCFLSVSVLFSSAHNSAYYWLGITMLLICAVRLGVHMYKLYVLSVLNSLINSPNLLSDVQEGEDDVVSDVQKKIVLDGIVKTAYRTLYIGLGGEDNKPR